MYATSYQGCMQLIFGIINIARLGTSLQWLRDVSCNHNIISYNYVKPSNKSQNVRLLHWAILNNELTEE